MWHYVAGQVVPSISTECHETLNKAVSYPEDLDPRWQNFTSEALGAYSMCFVFISVIPYTHQKHWIVFRNSWIQHSWTQELVHVYHVTSPKTNNCSPEQTIMCNFILKNKHKSMPLFFNASMSYNSFFFPINMLNTFSKYYKLN